MHTVLVGVLVDCRFAHLAEAGDVPAHWFDTISAMASEKQRMLRGERYLATDPDLAAERQRCRVLTERFNALPAGEPDERTAILHELLREVGEQTEVMAPFQCDYGWQISIGARTFINYGLVVLDAAEVSIGDDVQIGPGVQLITALHPLEPGPRREGVETAAPVRIERGAWLAAGVIVLPGVTVGADAVIGAGSVVTRDMPAGQLCFGNPCRAIRSISGGD